MKSEKLWPEQQIRAVELMSSILPNEFLFSICYLLGEWNQRISLVKLCKMHPPQQESSTLSFATI
jgi:hypothetical protein